MSISPILDRLQNYFNKNEIIALEIGARYGESSTLIIKNLNVKEYIIVDPYTSYDEYTQDGFNQIIKNNEDNIYNETKNNLLKIHNNVKFFRTFSNDINTLNQIENNSIDLIFIDGNHTYKYVLEDLENYFPKLKKNGIICGDDFFMRMDKNDILKTLNNDYNEPMVYEAVIDFCNKYDKKFIEYGIHAGYGKVYEIIEK